MSATHQQEPIRSLNKLGSRPKILYVRDTDDGSDSLPEAITATFDVVEVVGRARALDSLTQADFAGVFVDSHRFAEAIQLGQLVESQRILEGMPDGVVLLSENNTILWSNEQMKKWSPLDNTEGESFYRALGEAEIIGPDFCPFSTALATGEASESTLRIENGSYFHVHAAPVVEPDTVPNHLIVTIRDVTHEVLQQQKLAAIHKAGIELADLTPDEVFEMAVDDRIDLLKSNILHYTQDLLNFDVVEIRLLEPNSPILKTLLSYGLDDDASNRPLVASPTGNGVTGFVAATGKSYLCEDTAEDPLYIQGFQGAKSSLTVPLIWHDEVVGTFNVESPDTRAFTESDLQFLEIFSRDVAAALNTLQLMAAEKASTTQENVEAIHSAVALPVDVILNDAVHVIEQYRGHDSDVTERLQRILRNARDIKQVIQQVGQKLSPGQALPAGVQSDQWPHLRSKRVLVADADAAVRNDAHSFLERFGCIVETAHHGSEATYMVRNSGPDCKYDVIIADIRLPDMNGYEFLTKLKEYLPEPPLVLMTGFGYDPGHSIVKARQAGLLPGAVLYKPFRLDQLVQTMELVLGASEA